MAIKLYLSRNAPGFNDVAVFGKSVYLNGVGYYLVEYPVPQFPRITHFGYCDGEPGRNIGEHYHLGYELVYVKRGQAHIKVFSEGDPILCTADDAFVTAPHVSHSFGIHHVDICYYWVGIQTDQSVGITSDHRIPPHRLLSRRPVSSRYLIPDHDYPELLKLGSTLPLNNFALLRNVPEFHAPFESLLREIESAKHLRLFLIYSKLLELMVLLHRRLLPENERTSRSEIVQAVADHVRTHCDEPLSLERLAEVAGISSSYLSRRFAGETGHNLSEYIRSCRIDRAKELLLRGLPVGDVAVRSGFASIYSFSTVFKREVGCAPSGYRGLLATAGK